MAYYFFVSYVGEYHWVLAFTPVNIYILHDQTNVSTCSIYCSIFTYPCVMNNALIGQLFLETSIVMFMCVDPIGSFPHDHYFSTVIGH